MSVMEKIYNKNGFLLHNNTFVRNFISGQKIVEIDSTGRIQIARDLVTYAGITKDVVISPTFNAIEIWDKERYEKAINISNEEFIALTEKVMGSSENNG